MNKGSEETTEVDITEVKRMILCNYIISGTIFAKVAPKFWHFTGIVKTTIYNKEHK
jgi:hypothetical protein